MPVGESRGRKDTDALYLPSLTWSRYIQSVSRGPQGELKPSESRKLHQNSTANSCQAGQNYSFFVQHFVLIVNLVTFAIGKFWDVSELEGSKFLFVQM